MNEKKEDKQAQAEAKAIAKAEKREAEKVAKEEKARKATEVLDGGSKRARTPPTCANVLSYIKQTEFSIGWTKCKKCKIKFCSSLFCQEILTQHEKLHL